MDKIEKRREVIEEVCGRQRVRGGADIRKRNERG